MVRLRRGHDCDDALDAAAPTPAFARCLACIAVRWFVPGVLAVGEGSVFAPVPQLLVSADAAGVDPPENLDAVSGPASDLGCRGTPLIPIHPDRSEEHTSELQ